MANTKPRPYLLIFDPIGDFAELSNFFPGRFASGEFSFESAEHYYQAEKFTSPADRDRILACPTAAEARDLAWSELHAAVRADWDAVRVDVMRSALRHKFGACEVAQRKLRSTWPYPIVENSPVDGFWGVGSGGHGHNTLGMLLERIRSDLLGLPTISVRADGHSGWGLSPESRISSIECLRYEVSEARVPFDPSTLASGSLTLSCIDELIAGRSIDEDAPPGLARSPAGTGLIGGGFRPGENGNPDAVPSMSSQPAALPRSRVLGLRGEAFDKKYMGYRWTEDARSAVLDWSDGFLAWLARKLPTPSTTARGVVVGAGAGDEAAMVWSRFPGELLLVDVGEALSLGCARQHPNAEARCLPAEDLEDVGDASFDFYCSLRTYQSVHFDATAAIHEAHRVLRPGGLVVISVSDAYLRTDGGLQRGLIMEDHISITAGFILLCKLADMLRCVGFESIGFHGLETEMVVFGYRAGAPR